jgi:hypothetical protein|nr:MAG TPA: phenylalanyl-tRNA synthetase subunit alpha [Caudoviricetes sp.]
MEYQQLVRENQRLAVLKFLKDDGDYTLNTSILQDGLTAIGLDISRDKLETEVFWLAEQGLVEIEHFKSVTVVRLTGRGLEAAEGRVRVPGVKRPRPA